MTLPEESGTRFLYYFSVMSICSKNSLSVLWALPPWRCSRKASAKVLLFSIPAKCLQEKIDVLCNIFALFDKTMANSMGDYLLYITQVSAWVVMPHKKDMQRYNKVLKHQYHKSLLWKNAACFHWPRFLRLYLEGQNVTLLHCYIVTLSDR